MSLQDVATVAEISKAHVWDMEQGHSRNPSIETVCGLARALKADPVTLCSAAIVDNGMAIPIAACDALADVGIKRKKRQKQLAAN